MRMRFGNINPSSTHKYTWNGYHFCWLIRGVWGSSCSGLAGVGTQLLGNIAMQIVTESDIRTYMLTYMLTYIHTYMHACMHTYTHRHTHIHTYTHTCMQHACIYTYMHACIHTFIHTYIHSYIHT